MVDCVDGHYEPYRPEEFVCEVAIALLVTTDGQVEVFSEAQSQLLLTIPDTKLTGHSVDLMAWVQKIGNC